MNKGLASADGTGLPMNEAVPSSPAVGIPDAVKLTANETEALRGLVGTDRHERFRTFGGVSSHCELPKHLIRRTVRALARKGLAIYEKGLWSDDGMPAGAGYALTQAGSDMADALGMEPRYDY